MDRLSAILDSAVAGKISWTVLRHLGRFLYKFLKAKTISDSKAHAMSFKRERHGEERLGSAHPEIAPWYTK